MTTSQIIRHSTIDPRLECIRPTYDELNYETSQIPCPHRNRHCQSDKCQRLFKNIMALNVHLQMYHKETGILTVCQSMITIDRCLYHYARTFS
jgi:hypothetical protein